MFEPGKRREDATDRVERTPAQHGVGCGRHDVAHVMVADDANLASATNLLPNTGDRRHDPVAFEVGSPRHIRTDRRCGRKPQTFRTDTMSQRGHTVIVKIEQGKIRCSLILEDPLLRRDIFIQRLITVLVIDRHVEQGGDPGMEPVNRFKLKTGDLHYEIIIRSRLPCLARAKIFHRCVTQRDAQIAADKHAPAALGEHLADQRHGGTLAVGTGNRKERAPEELRGQLHFTDHLHATPACRFDRGKPIGHTGADHH